MVEQMPLRRAEAAYRGYAAATGGKTFDGRDMPPWDDLPERTVNAWTAAAEAIGPELPEVRLLRPQAGDVLVFRFDDAYMSEMEVDEMVTRALALVGIPDVRVLVLSAGSDVEVIRKDGD